MPTPPSIPGALMTHLDRGSSYPPATRHTSLPSREFHTYLQCIF